MNSPAPPPPRRPAGNPRLRLSAPDAHPTDAANGGVGTAPAGADAALRAATMIPAQLLQPGEVIILLLKPHPLYILLWPLKTLTILLLVTLLGVMFARDVQAYDTAQNIVLLGSLLIAARLFWQFLEWLSRVYIMTDQRIVTVAGVLRIRVFETPLHNLTHSELLFSLRERFFALGTLGFYTPGSAVGEAYWVMVASPLDVHAKVVQTLKRYRR